MILLLNGPFGVGKTTVACILQKRLACSIIFDPEEVGFMLRTILNQYDPVNDFQDYALWRNLVPRIATSLLYQYSEKIIVPMTIWRKDYFEEIVGTLSCEKAEFLPILLTGSRSILRERILHRPEKEGAHAWSLAHLDKSLASFADPVFGDNIDTSGISPEQVADAVIEKLC